MYYSYYIMQSLPVVLCVGSVCSKEWHAWPLWSLINSKMADMVKLDSLITGGCPAGDLPKRRCF